MVSKLDTVTSKEWETSVSGNEMPTLKSLIEFLTSRCQALEAVSSKTSHSSAVKKGTNNKAKQASAHVASASRKVCPKCSGDHLIYYCPEFLKLEIDKRQSFVKGKKLCTNCLKPADHQINDCKSRPCRKCEKKYNTLLHFESKKASSSNQHQRSGNVRLPCDQSGAYRNIS